VLHLFDTAQGKVVPLETREPGKVSMYVCGPTVYGPPHLGHGRFSLVFDVLRRYLEWSGLEVRYVSNITDIDDKIIDRAQREGRPWQDITTKCESIWFKAMDGIGVKRPTVTPHATEYVEQMVALIAELLASGKAYETSDGVYLDCSTVEGYGLLARQSLDSLQSGARVEGNDEKRNPIDFALWKKAKPGEPTWPAPWGDGRPGWHTECVVMSLDLLGDGFDLHGGGQDLAFPHHENERAQAIAVGRTFARHWAHNGFVEVDGEKMSKSLGNFTNLLDLLDRHDGRSYRMLVLRSHYRSPVEVTAATIADAERSLDRLDAFARRTVGLIDASTEPDPATMEQFRRAMDDDLNTAGALDQVFRAVRAANTALDAEDDATAVGLAAAVREICRAVGLDLREEDTAGPPQDVLILAEQRAVARAAKDFAEADRLRAALSERGWLVEDSAQGPLLRRKG
jgi:cysteinyl-tRNA synthetase